MRLSAGDKRDNQKQDVIASGREAIYMVNWRSNDNDVMLLYNKMSKRFF